LFWGIPLLSKKDLLFGPEFSGMWRVFGMGTIFKLAEKFGTQLGKRDLTPSGVSAASDIASYSVYPKKSRFGPIFARE
jgi:hypothetical protein